MRHDIVRYPTEAFLLSLANLPDGTVAEAYDNKRKYMYSASDGWVRLERPTDAQLVPTPSAAGQILGVDAAVESAFVTRNSAGRFTATVDFTDSTAAHDLINVMIPGGAMGPNGILRIGASGFINAGTANVQMQFLQTVGVTTATTTQTFPSSAGYGLLLQGELRNLNNEAVQARRWMRGEMSNKTPAMNTSAATTVDTSTDWPMIVQVKVDNTTGLTPGEAYIDNAWYETIYLP